MREALKNSLRRRGSHPSRGFFKIRIPRGCRTSRLPEKILKKTTRKVLTKAAIRVVSPPPLDGGPVRDRRPTSRPRAAQTPPGVRWKKFFDNVAQQIPCQVRGELHRPQRRRGEKCWVEKQILNCALRVTHSWRTGDARGRTRGVPQGPPRGPAGQFGSPRANPSGSNRGLTPIPFFIRRV